MLTPVQFTPLKRYDLMMMMGINVRASFACAQACIPFMKSSENAHILTLSPPIDLDPRWFGARALHHFEVRDDHVDNGASRGAPR